MSRSPPSPSRTAHPSGANRASSTAPGGGVLPHRPSERELFSDLATRAPGPQMVALAVAALVLFTLRDRIPLPAGLTWFALLTVVTALRVLGPLQGQERGRASPEHLLRRHRLLTFAAGALWGTLPWLTWPTQRVEDFFLLTMAIFVLVVGAAETYALLRGQFEAFAWPAGGSLVVRALTFEEPQTGAAGLVVAVFLVFMTAIAVRRRRRLADLEAADRLFSALHLAATRPDAAPDVAFEPLLAAGCDYLGLDLGIVSEIRGQEYQILALHSVSGSPPPDGSAPLVGPGSVLPLEDTVCAYTIHVDEPVSYARDTPPGIHHPGYREQAPTYIGRRITVDGMPFGTINFSDPRRTRLRVTPFQREMIELLADWLGTELGRRRAEAQQKRERGALELLTDSIPALIAYIDPDLTYQYVNSQYEKLLGRPRETFRGVTVESLAGEKAFATIRPHLEQAMAGKEQTFEVSPSLATGHRPTFVVHYVPDRDAKGEVRGCFALLHEITPYKETETRLREEAHHDFLTGLLNRRAFFTSVVALLSEKRKRPARDFVCYLDLDGFKRINDTCGHGAGDEALRRVAAVMRDAIRTTDLLARLGGDEFALVLTGCTREEAREYLEKLATRIRSEHFSWQGRSFDLSISIGAVPLERRPDHDDADPEGIARTLVRRADEACYQAKRDPERSVVLAP